MKETRKRCPKCGVTKDYSEYHKSRNNSRGIQSRCKACQKAELVARKKKNPERYAKLSRDWKAKNRDKVNKASRWYKIKAAYGLTEQEYDDLLAKQGHRCAICETLEPKGKGIWHIDHCHETGKVRAILCHHCNVGLGHFQDSISLLQKAVDYVTYYRELHKGK